MIKPGTYIVRGDGVHHAYALRPPLQSGDVVEVKPEECVDGMLNGMFETGALISYIAPIQTPDPAQSEAQEEKTFTKKK